MTQLGKDFERSAFLDLTFLRTLKWNLWKVSSKPAGIPEAVTEQWLDVVWPKLQEGYNDNNI